MTLSELAGRVGFPVDPELTGVNIKGVASLSEAQEGDLSFFADPRYTKALRSSRATAVLVPADFSEKCDPVTVPVDDPAGTFAEILKLFAPPAPEFSPGIHPTAVVHPDAKVDSSVCIGPCAVVDAGVVIGARTIVGSHCYLGQNVVVGEGCHFHPHVVICHGCFIGNNVILHPSVVIGSDGFGYEFRNGCHVKIPQTGIVVVEDDVEIGAGSTIDRARFGRTCIGRGSKIDNLVQIGHNVVIGPHTILCAQVGISGSTRVGSYVTMAGKAGVNGHIEVGDRATIAAMSGVTKTVEPGEVLVGLPARPMKTFKKNFVQLANIQKLYDRVKQLEQRLSSMKEESPEQ